MTWTDIDPRLQALGKDRVWLSDVTPYSLTSIRDALGPSSKKRSDRMLAILSRAIEDEEARQRPAAPREIRPGVFEIFDLTTPAGEEQFALVDRASRIVQAPSITEFCRDVLISASERILRKERAGLYGDIPGVTPMPKVAESADQTGSSAIPDPLVPDPFPGAGDASTTGASPGESPTDDRGNGTTA